jgi:hypothetical protein
MGYVFCKKAAQTVPVPPKIFMAVVKAIRTMPVVRRFFPVLSSILSSLLQTRLS